MQLEFIVKYIMLINYPTYNFYIFNIFLLALEPKGGF